MIVLYIIMIICLIAFVNWSSSEDRSWVQDSQKNIKKIEEDKLNGVKPNIELQKICSKCSSTEFTPVRRRWSVGTGLLTNKIDLICNKCGSKIG